jgi:hypothetical protein
MGTNQIFDIEICSGWCRWKMCRTYPVRITIIPLVCSSSLLYLNSIRCLSRLCLEMEKRLPHTHTDAGRALLTLYLSSNDVWASCWPFWILFFDIINEENFLSVFFFLPSVMPPFYMSASFVICKPNPPCVLVCGRDWDIILVVWWDGSPTRSYLESTAGAISCWFPDVMRLGAFIFFELNVHQRNLCQLNLDYIYRFDIQGQRPGSMAVGRITTVQVYSLFLSSAILI